MISNERQYRITRRQLSRFQRAIADFDLKQAAVASCDDLAKAELDALKSEEAVLAGQVADYERLRAGGVTKLTAASLGDLPSILIRARIAKGLSQRQLADLLGVKEQQIQRYEADAYASASLRRLREVAEALQLDIVETAHFRPGSLAGGAGGETVRWQRHKAGQRPVAQRCRPRLTR